MNVSPIFGKNYTTSRLTTIAILSNRVNATVDRYNYGYGCFTTISPLAFLQKSTFCHRSKFKVSKDFNFKRRVCMSFVQIWCMMCDFEFVQTKGGVQITMLTPAGLPHPSAQAVEMLTVTWSQKRFWTTWRTPRVGDFDIWRLTNLYLTNNFKFLEHFSETWFVWTFTIVVFFRVKH